MRPQTEKELADAIRGSNGPVCIRGGGTRGMAIDGDPLETGALSGVTLYEPGALTMVAGAGTPLADIEAALAAEGQMLAFEPGDLAGMTDATGVSTIGGVFATNASGPRRVQVGAARDFLLGVRFVDGSGNIIKNGGRVMKNVTGYDLVKLMAGSHGTLGVMTEVSFKVLPQPETAATLMVSGVEGADAVALMAAALSSPFEITGAFHNPRDEAGTALTLLRVEGFEQSVAYRVQQLKALLAPRLSGRAGQEIDVSTDPVQVSQQWQRVRNGAVSSTTKADVWKISAKPSDAPVLVGKLPEGSHYSLDWGGGLIWVTCTPGTDLRGKLGAFDGHATLVYQDTNAGIARFQPEPPLINRMTRGLRMKFDPRGILNTGLMG